VSAPAAAAVVTAAFVARGGRVLLGRRSSGGSRGLWELPGGKVEAGETPRGALERELSEELGLGCEPGRLLHDGVHPAGERFLRFMVFETSLSGDPVSSNAHDALAWVSANELERYVLAPLDVPVLPGLMPAERF